MTQESIVLSTTPPYPGLQMVQDINKALEALGTNFAGPNDPAAFAKPFMTWADTSNMLFKRRNAANADWDVAGALSLNPGNDHAGAEPTSPFPYMRWADTTNALLKRRNVDNTAWVVLGSLLRRSTPEYAANEIPTTDLGPIDVIGIGRMEWAGTKYDVTLSAFSAYSTANQALTAGPRTKVLFAGERYDTEGEFFGSTYTAIKPGIRTFGSFVKITGTSMTFIAADLFKNGSLFSGGEIIAVSGIAGRAFVGADVALEAGDTVEIYAYSQTGTSLAFTRTSDADTCTFYGHFVRPLP